MAADRMTDNVPSVSTSLFLESARNLATRLEAEPAAPSVAAMLREAHELTVTFGSWKETRPVYDVRVATIQRLFDLNRRVMDYFAAARGR